ncbi:hypothetical protein ABN034_16775 [Actinopolymorpha sp. B11F2]|uniref:hypothetical protein n=1 Tax=Actinopolymorpha sp. B11F2 TaxID=3160862 RepID=UPI0032E3D96C
MARPAAAGDIDELVAWLRCVRSGRPGVGAGITRFPHAAVGRASGIRRATAVARAWT